MQQPVTDNSKRFLNMSGGLLMGMITAIILLCCIGPIALCFFGGFIGAVGDATTPDPTVEVISCQIDDKDDFLPKTEVTVKVTNTASTEQFVSVDIELQNASGTKVGDTITFVTVKANSSAQETVTIYQDAPGGTKCAATVD